MGIDENVNSQFPVGYMQSNMNIYIYMDLPPQNPAISAYTPFLDKLIL